MEQGSNLNQNEKRNPDPNQSFGSDTLLDHQGYLDDCHNQKCKKNHLTTRLQCRKKVKFLAVTGMVPVPLLTKFCVFLARLILLLAPENLDKANFILNARFGSGSEEKSYAPDLDPAK